MRNEKHFEGDTFIKTSLVIDPSSRGRRFIAPNELLSLQYHRDERVSK
jgi:hypothetical protein